MSGESRRDRAIDHLLSTAGPSGGDPTPECPGADLIAAWAEGTLTAGEQQRIEEHLASCARCQSVVAVFARTLPEVRPAPLLTFWKRPVVRWAVPLAAAATLVVVVMLREPDPSPLPVETQARVEPVERAGEFAAPMPAPSEPVSGGTSQTATPARDGESETRTGVPSDGISERASEQVAQSASQASEAASLGAPPAAPSRSVSVVQGIPRALPAAPAGPAPASAPLPSPPADFVVDESASGVANLPLEADAAGSLQLLLLPPQAGAAPLPVTVRTPAGEAQWMIQADGALLRAAPPSSASVARGRAGSVADTVLVQGQREAGPAPSGARAEAAPNSWTPVPLDPSVRLAAGAAPSRDVAWFVGAGGTVLRTLDGQTFTRVAFPDASSLVAVAAADADRAVVATEDGRRYATEDGGQTWTLR